MGSNRIGDFSRFPFRADKHYSGVHLQQGRVQLDSDWNAQVEIAAHQLRTRTRDLIGESGAPASNPGFEITAEYALEFDGKDDYMQIGGEGVTTYNKAGGLTLQARLQPRGPGTLLIAVIRDPQEEVRWRTHFLVDIQKDGRVRLHRSGVKAVDLRSEISISRDSATELKVELGEEGCRIFFDGALVGQDDQGAGMPEGETCFLVGGGSTPEDHQRDQVDHPYLNCLLWELSVFKGCQPTSETGMELPLEVLGEWKCDQGSGKVVRDSAPDGNQALLGAGTDRPTWVMCAAQVGAGRYYVHGILCELENDVDYTKQPDLPGAELPTAEGMHLFYLDVWERSVSALEDPSLLEPALSGSDTTTRSQVVAQVKCRPIAEPGRSPQSDDLLERWDLLAQQGGRGSLSAKRDDRSVTLGNHLYRVEIHASSASGKSATESGQASFKWSRLNASANWPIRAVTAGAQVVELKGHPMHNAELEVGNWVEVLDDRTVLNGEASELCRVEGVDLDAGTVRLDRPVPAGVGMDKLLMPLLRRWDQTAGASGSEGAIAVTSEWTELEAGIKVKFGRGERYRIGDYWQIPARTLTQDVEWPRDGEKALFEPPHGISHYYCPLAILAIDPEGFEIRDSRAKPFFKPLAEGTRSDDDGETGKIAGDVEVTGKLSAKEIDGQLAPDSVNTGALFDGAVTESKLDRALGTVPVGYAILGPSPPPGSGYEPTGSKIEFKNEDLHWDVFRLPATSEGTQTTTEGKAHLVAVDDALLLLAESGELWKVEPRPHPQPPKLTPCARFREERTEFSVTVADGKIYVVGGKEGGRLTGATSCYDPRSDRWTDLGTPLSTPRKELALAVDNEKIYALGGLRKFLWAEVSTSRVESFVGTGPWRKEPSMPAARHGLGAAALANRVFALGGRRVFLFGFLGRLTTSSLQTLNPIARLWDRRRTPLPTARSDFQVESIADRLHLIAGKAPLQLADDVDVYDPAVDAWSRLTSLPQPVEGAGAAEVDGALWVAGFVGPADRREILLQSCDVVTTFHVLRKSSQKREETSGGGGA